MVAAIAIICGAACPAFHNIATSSSIASYRSERCSHVESRVASDATTKAFPQAGLSKSPHSQERTARSSASATMELSQQSIVLTAVRRSIAVKDALTACPMFIFDSDQDHGQKSLKAELGCGRPASEGTARPRRPQAISAGRDRAGTERSYWSA